MKVLAGYARSILSAMALVAMVFFGIASTALAGEWNAQHLGVVVTTPDARWKVVVDQISPTVGRLSLADDEKKAATRLIVTAVPGEVALPAEVFIKAQYEAHLKIYFGVTSFDLVSKSIHDVTLAGDVKAKYVQHEFKNWSGSLRSVGMLYGDAFVSGKTSRFVMFVSNFRLHEPLTVNHPDVVRLIKDLRVMDERM